MRKFEILIIIGFMVLFVNTPCAKAQTPVNDISWELQDNDHGSDDFSSLDTIDRWYSRLKWIGATYNYDNGGAALYHYSNLDWSDDTLIFRADSLAPDDWVLVQPSQYHDPESVGVHYAYTGGIIWRRQIYLEGNWVDAYHFGYIEISAKFPTGYWSVWPSFWLYGGGGCPDGTFINELDINENLPAIVVDGHKTSSNTFIDEDGACYPVQNFEEINTGFLLSSAYHKYACEWAPDRLIFYIDDIPVRTIYDPTGVLITQHRMTLILGMGVAAGDAWLPDDWNTFSHENKTPTNYPQLFKVDYLKYYKLNTDCSTDLSICTPGDDYSSRAVEKSITAGSAGGGCAPNFNQTTPGTSYTLRATDYVTLQAGTIINPSGTGYFAIQTMACPE